MKRRKITEVMTNDVVAIAPDTPFAEIVRTLQTHHFNAVPVVAPRSRKVLGIVTEADLLRKTEFTDPDSTHEPLFRRAAYRRAQDKAVAVDAAGLMTSPVISVGPGTTVAAAARILAERGVKQALVVNDEGELLGIFARSDLLAAYLRPDDEIRQEIIDEVIVRSLWQDPEKIGVDVREGVVHLSGQIETRGLISLAVQLSAATAGVVDVTESLTYEIDDTLSSARYPGI